MDNEKANSSKYWISESTLIKVQAGSGLVLSAFVIAHLANHVSALWGQDTFDRVLGQLRQVYQAHPVSEALLVVAAPVLHVGSSLLRMARRKQREFKKAATPGDNAVESHTSVVPLHTRLARFSGVGMIWLFTLHATASRLGPVLQNLPKPDSRHLAGALSSTGMTIYMMVFSCMAVYHMSALMFQALGAFQKQLFGETRLRQWIRNALARDRKGIHPVSLGTTIVGCSLMIASVLAMGGRLFPVEAVAAHHH